MRDRIRSCLSAALVLALAIGLHTHALADTHLVPGDFTTITAALAAAGSGDTVLVAAGVYSPSSNGETFPLFVTDDSLCLLGAGMGVSIIDAESTGTVVRCDGSVGGRVSGFTITGGWADRAGGVWVRLDTPMEIDHNLIKGNGALLQGEAMMVDADAWVHHNVIWESFDIDTTDDRDPHVVQSQGTTSALIEHNLIGRGDGNGLIVHNPSAPVVRHNIFMENGMVAPDFRGRGICWFSDSLPVVYHNLFYNNAVAALLVPALGGDYSGEDANDLFPDDGIYGNVDGDPLLVDPDNDDFHLSPGSPAIDAGDPTLPGDPDGTVADIGPFFFDQSGGGVEPRESIAGTGLLVLSGPFDREVTLELTLPEPGPVSLAVYDVYGRRIVMLAEGFFRNGASRVTWNRRNEAGSPVGPGVYFARLRAGRLSVTARLPLLH